MHTWARRKTASAAEQGSQDSGNHGSSLWSGRRGWQSWSAASCLTGVLVWEEGVVEQFYCLWLSWSSGLEGGGGWFRYLDWTWSLSAGGGWVALLLLTGLVFWFSRGVAGLLCCA